MLKQRQRMDYFAQQLINGIVLGSIYGLIAIGYTMVYGIVGMINFAHGDIFMIGGFIALIAFLILVSIGLTVVPVILLIVLLVSMAITALYGWTVERIAYRPLRHSFRLAPLLSAIGMSFVLTNYRRSRRARASSRCRRSSPAATRCMRARRLRRAALQRPDHRRDHHRRAAGDLHLAGGAHPARPRHARLRAGPDHGGAARRRRRPHHLA